jgi:hypothetical protein
VLIWYVLPDDHSIIGRIAFSTGELSGSYDLRPGSAVPVTEVAGDRHFGLG